MVFLMFKQCEVLQEMGMHALTESPILYTDLLGCI